MSKLYRSLILMVLCLSVSLPLLADEAEKPWWFEAQAVSGKNPSLVIGYYEKDFKDSKFGFYVTAVKESDGYHEFYAGPTWKPADWLKVGVGLGREVVPGELHGVRRNFFYDANWEKFSSFGTFESGVSGPWHKVTVTYNFSDKIGAGVMSQSFLGIGVRGVYNIPETKMQVWGALLHDSATGTNNTVFAVNFSF